MTVYLGAVDEALVTELERRVGQRWRPLDGASCVAEWQPDLPRWWLDRAAVAITNTAGVDRAFLAPLWAHFEAANTDGLPIEAIEITGLSRYRSPSQCAPLHRDDNQVDGSGSRLLAMTLAVTPATEYEGGELVVIDPAGHLRRFVLERGAVVIFPAWWRHGVTRVRTGVREAFVARATRAEPGPDPRVRMPDGGVLGFSHPDAGEWGRMHHRQRDHARAGARTPTDLQRLMAGCD